MKKSTYPKLFSPKQWADANKSFDGSIEIANFSRLDDMVLSKEGVIEASLVCNYNVSGKLEVIGHLQGELTMLCQRCLEGCVVKVESSFCLRPVYTLEQNANEEMPDDVEPILLNEDGETEFLAIIEDELLLSMPAVAKHDNDCLAQTQFGELAEEAYTQKPNPFDVLQQLKKQ